MYRREILKGLAVLPVIPAFGLAMKQEELRIKTGFPQLDSWLGDGLKAGEALTFYGAQGCGKTRIIEQIAASHGFIMRDNDDYRNCSGNDLLYINPKTSKWQILARNKDELQLPDYVFDSVAICAVQTDILPEVFKKSTYVVHLRKYCDGMAEATLVKPYQVGRQSFFMCFRRGEVCQLL